MLAPDHRLEIEDPEYDDGATILDDGLSTFGDEEQRPRITSSQAAAKRAAAKHYRLFTLFLLFFSFMASVIVAMMVYYRNPRAAASQESAVDMFGGTSKSRQEENELRFRQTLEYLIKYDVSDPDTLSTGPTYLSNGEGGLYTAQYRAALWISKHDKFRISIPSTDEPSREDYPFLQRYALAVFFFSTGGLDKWRWKMNFLMGYHECAWYDNFQVQGVEGDVPFGVLCDGKPDLEENSEDVWDGERTVTGISIPPMNNLLGTLPPELRYLKYMKLVILQQNEGLIGSIPFQYGWFDHLQIMALAYNSLTGMIPRGFEFMEKMEILRLENNNLSGNTINGDLDFLKGMKNLAYLDLDYNAKIEGTVPEVLSELTNLEILFMSGNGLYGKIPDISKLTKLKILSFAGTDMDGTLPSSLAQLTNLKGLYLDDCNFEGSLDVIHSMSNLSHVYLENNYFNDTLDNSSFVDLENLVHLDISNCSLTGPVPGHLFNFAKLEVLDMHKNKLTGELPVEAIANVNETKLSFLSLHSNNITGSIPESVGMLKNLATLDLSDNGFKGIMPAEIGELGNLGILFLGKNNFDEAPVPEWIRNLTQLTELSLKDSALIETIPEWLGELTKLTFLDLGENSLSKTIPQSLGNLTQLMVLILNSNKLTGELGLGELRNLEAIVIDDNDLTGNTDAMCEHTMMHFISDCANTTGVSELECECCTLCCSDENTTCNDSEWEGNHEGMWEFGYARIGWEFEEGYVTPYINYNLWQEMNEIGI